MVLHSFVDVVVWNSFADIVVWYSFADIVVLYLFAHIVVLYSFTDDPSYFDTVGDFTLSCDVAFIAGDVQDKDTYDDMCFS